MAPLKRSDLLLCILVMAGGALSGTLDFWASNAWDLAAPQSVLSIPALGLLAGASVWLGMTYNRRLRSLPVAMFVAGLLYFLGNWRNIGSPPPFLWIVLTGGLTLVVHRKASDGLLRRVSAVLVVALLLAPIAQVAYQHYLQRHAFQLAPTSPPLEARPTGNVEDIALIVVDGYPMLTAAQNWFQHDIEPIKHVLSEAGFEVAVSAWSHNTFSNLAMPTMLQLRQVLDESSSSAWGNRKTNYSITRGENFVADTLRVAGFEYTHIESGWNGDVCGEVEVCLHSTWLDEANWNLLQRTPFGPYLVSEHGSYLVGGTLAATEHLTRLSVFDDGQHDYVFAHLLLPHDPYVVDSDCTVLPPESRTDPDESLPIRRQLSCVDLLLAEIVGKFDEDTAVVITGDHGTRLNMNAEFAENGWSDTDIVDHLGTFLAYRLPSRCKGPTRQTNLYALRAVMECSVHADIPSTTGEFVLGVDKPVWVEPEQLESIANDLKLGRVLPPDR